VILYGYNSNVAFKTSTAGVYEHAENLLSRLKAKRSDAPDRPLVLICHSLGGIVVKQMLVLAKLNDSYSKIRKAAYGIAFFGTPHRGGNSARLGDVASSIARSVLRNPQNNLMEALKSDSLFSDSLIQNFRHQLEDFHIISFYETRSFKGLGLVVDRRSATLGLAGKRERQVAVDADHSRICKFEEPDDTYEHVEDCLAELIEGAIKNAADRQAKELQASKEQATEWQPQDEEFLHSIYTSDYDGHKNTIISAVLGTCKWFLKHAQYTDWLDPYHSRLLWVSGDPGCGKSVLSKFLIESLQTTSSTSLESGCLLYFFCDDKIEAQRPAISILQALVHQLLVQKPELILNLRSHIHRKGLQAGKELHTLWEIFLQCCNDPVSKNVFVVIDALDECEEKGRNVLLGLIQKHFSVNHRKPDGHVLKILMTSRPEVRIADIIENVPNVRLRVENEGSNIRNDIALVVQDRLEKASASVGFTRKVSTSLHSRLLDGAGQTFLWVSLAMQVLEQSAEASEAALIEVLEELPEGLDDIYETILRRVRPNQVAKVTKVLQLLVCSFKPLQLAELNIALALDDKDMSLGNVTSRLEPRFDRTLQVLCGPFLRISEHRVDLVHQTAKEFLLRPRATLLSATPSLHNLTWKYCVDPVKAHQTLANICMTYILSRHPLVQQAESERLGDARKLLLNYASDYWDAHLREIDSKWPDDLIETALDLCQPRTKDLEFCCQRWRYNKVVVKPMTLLAAASLFGLDIIVTTVLDRGYDVNLVSLLGDTALTFAAIGGHESTIRLLLDNGANPQRFNVMKAALNFRRSGVVRLLLEKGSEISQDGMKEMAIAAESGDVALLTLLFKRGITAYGKTLESDETPIYVAAERGHIPFVQELLAQGVSWGHENKDGSIAIDVAAEKGQTHILRLLVSKPYQSFVKLKAGKAVYLAATSGHQDALSTLILNGAPTSWADEIGRNALHRAAEHGHDDILKLLVEFGSSVNDKNGMGETALISAARNGHTEAVEALLSLQANANCQDIIGWTALCWAVLGGHERAADMLLKAGCSAYVALQFLEKSSLWQSNSQKNSEIVGKLWSASMVEGDDQLQQLLRPIGRSPSGVFILGEINKRMVKISVSSGSTSSITSLIGAKQLDIHRLIDTRYSGMAKGVSSVRIVGRVHFTMAKIGDQETSLSLVVLETIHAPSEVLLGMNFLRIHRAVIDFENEVLVLDGKTVPLILSWNMDWNNREVLLR
jgi:ankyrin repeat protein